MNTSQLFLFLFLDPMSPLLHPSLSYPPRKEILSLTSLSDLSFTTNKGRTLGPGNAEEQVAALKMSRPFDVVTS